ncbi:ABC transporter ATP-binding protein [Streptococcus oricebi]|uniref:ABC transporter ATP-binding protein n=1 Tax=Streptococcus oricebi TaxID=1547447 RepID=A0ABS5B1V8_9STRE|nr:ABC transporter ATP-binding protein [Streptococcus oricebi]MBP2622656.1 ABC transporter ATP-binding protein [Streptococcus oricebi]
MLLETKNVSKLYGNKPAVNGLNLSINRGSFTAILGPNGAGKSTTIQMLIGLIQPSGGRIIYQEKIKLGVVFQNSVLDQALTVRENLEIRARQYRGLESDRVEEVIDQLGLTNFAQQTYGSLSGGQKRRVDIARALLNSPDILFLDEPTTGLDIQTRAAIWQLLRHLQEKQALTVVLTTHYLDEADDADQVYIVDQGRIIAQGSATDIKKDYAQNLLKISTWDAPAFEQALADYGLPASSMEEKREGEFILTLETSEQALELLSQTKSLISHFEYRPGTMDDAFMALTGREVR